ncbi:MAG: hypothetical protein ACK4UT_02980 [Moraxellaceae bacterium]
MRHILFAALLAATPVFALDDALDNARSELDTQLAETAGVISVSAGDCAGKPCLTVFVEDLEADSAKALPREFKNYPVEVKEGVVGF